MKEKLSQEEIVEKLQELLQERGRETLELARKTVLDEKVEPKEVYEALQYFMNEYWHDVARPALLSIACEAVGGNPKTTTPIAIPLSLISGAIDIHDDIIDQSKTKWSRPTVYGKFGKEMAILIGDALFFKGFTELNNATKKGIPAETVTEISNIIKKTFFELGEAEVLELQFRKRTDVKLDEYLNMIKKKAADVEAHTRISAILGKGTPEEVEALSSYGRLLGMLIILRDEMIDLIDVQELSHRITKEHLPIQVVYALEKTEKKAEIESLILKKRITKKDVKMLRDFTYNLNGQEYVANTMLKLVEQSSKYLEVMKNNKQKLKLLTEAMLPPPEWLSS